MRFLNACFLVLSLCLASVAQAGPATNNLRFCTDVHAPMRGIGYDDDEVVSAGPSGCGQLLDTATAGLPERTALDAVFVYSNRVVFSTDVDFLLNGTNYADEDLVEYDVNSGSLGMLIDASSAGVPETADLNAACFGATNAGTSYVSFDITVGLPGAGWLYDHDVLVLGGGGITNIIRPPGIPGSADIDALHVDETNLYFSLDISATINGSSGNDEDIWSMDLVTSNIVLLTGIGIEPRADLVALDYPLDTDSDWLTDFEESSGLDEAASTFPGTSKVLGPGGTRSDPFLADTDGDWLTDGEEAACGTDASNPGDVLKINAVVVNQGTNHTIRWASVPGKAYAIDSTASLVAGFTNELDNGLVAAVGTNETTYVDSTESENRHYRVRLEP